MDLQLPAYNLSQMLPEIFLFIWALLVITFDLVTSRKQGSATGYMAMLGLLITGILLALRTPGSGFGVMFENDAMSLFFKVIFLGAAFMAIGSSFGSLHQRIVNHRGEFFGLILLSTVGMMFLSSSNELLQLYVGLELTTIPLFILAAFYKDNKLSVESGIKYFIVGAFSSALLLYGISFLYGLGGTTELVQLRLNLAVLHLSNQGIGAILTLVVLLMLAGIGFKLALPPFHQWAPDVYEGAPTPITSFLSVGSKGAGLVAFAKIFLSGLVAFYGEEMAPNDWGIVMAIVAGAAMLYGNVVAIRQTNIKRMLAYSSIAQAGYIMIGMVSLNEQGLASVAYYIFAYLFANMGAFAIVAVFEDKTGSCQIASYRGLAQSSPGMALMMSVFLLSLAGIPPLAGFMAKYKVFAAAISMATGHAYYHWLYWLVGVGMLTSVFALFYYANILKQMYFSGEVSPYNIKFNLPAATVVTIGVVGVILFGVFAEPVFKYAAQIPAVYGFFPH